MKKILFVLLLSVFAVAEVECQNGPKLMLKQRYTMSYFKESYIVGMEACRDGGFNLYVNAEPMFIDHSDEMGIVVEDNDRKKFLSYLRQARAKYATWSKVARDHKVLSYSKEIPVNYTAYVYYRYNGYYYFQRGNAMQTWFTVDSKGKTYLKMSTRKLVADGKKNGGRFNMTFCTLGEIDKLISIIANSEEEFEKNQTEEMRRDALFQ